MSDFVRYAAAGHRHHVRGSAPGSLVLYTLDVTPVDPVAYRLPFERFLNLDRGTMPDIDFDFADERRDEVIRFVYERYGQDHVAQIITFGTSWCEPPSATSGASWEFRTARSTGSRRLSPTRSASRWMSRSAQDRPSRDGRR